MIEFIVLAILGALWRAQDGSDHKLPGSNAILGAIIGTYLFVLVDGHPAILLAIGGIVGYGLIQGYKDWNDISKMSVRCAFAIPAALIAFFYLGAEYAGLYIVVCLAANVSQPFTRPNLHTRVVEAIEGGLVLGGLVLLNVS